MDLLTHLFLPLTAAYVLWPDRFTSVWALGLAGFGVFPDFDKFLWMPGLLHSLLTLIPIAAGLVLAEYLVTDRLYYTPVAVALIASHLLLDFVDGGPVPLLFPLVKTGIGLTYPARTVFLAHFPWLTIEGPIVTLRTTAPRPSNHTYGFIKGAGVSSMLLFVITYYGRTRE